MNNNYFRYVGQKCPICNNEFSGNDDIVVCPLCGTPHHRECYKKNGECGNFDMHNDGFRWMPENVNTQSSVEQPVNEAPQNQNPFTEPIPPTYSGTPYSSTQASSTVFFSNQPNPFSLFPEEIADGVTTEEAADFVQASSYKYVQNFFYEKSKKKTFNWVAFLFAPYWFFYRKMHKLGAIFFAVFFSLSLLSTYSKPLVDLNNAVYDLNTKYETFDENMSDEEAESYLDQMTADLRGVFSSNVAGSVMLLVFSVANLGLHIFVGFKANKWYYDFTVKEIRKIKSQTSDTNQQKLLYYKNGGVAFGITAVVLIAEFIVSNALALLLL